MPIKLVCATTDEAVADIHDGATVMVGGFNVGTPEDLIRALLRKAPKNLTVISNSTAGHRTDQYDAAKLVEAGLVRKVINSFPIWNTGVNPTLRLWREKKLEVETVAQGTLAERLRAGMAGIGGFWTPSGAGTDFAKGKEVRDFDGRQHVLEMPIKADFALISAHLADEMGNLFYVRAQRNFNPLMAGAARVTIAEVDRIVSPGGIDPANVHTPGVYVRRLVVMPDPAYARAARTASSG